MTLEELKKKKKEYGFTNEQIAEMSKEIGRAHV